MTDEVTCRECYDPVEGLGSTFVVYGDYDRERQGFKRGDHSFHVCRSCWQSKYAAKKATSYQTTDADELWSILAASNGQLVADVSRFFIPGPCYARVKDDELEACSTKRVAAPADSEFDYDVEAEWMDPHDLFLEELLDRNADRDGPEFPIYLVTADETPFSELTDNVERRSRDLPKPGGEVA